VERDSTKNVAMISGPQLTRLVESKIRNWSIF
jgi:hypothetical protein